MAEAIVCAVCGEAADEKTSAVCNSCGQRFHLNQRNDMPGKDCGTVWIDDQYPALEFACQRCVDGQQSAPPPRLAGLRVLRPNVGRRRYRKQQ